MIQAFGGNRTSGSGWKGDFESETFLVKPVVSHPTQANATAAVLAFDTTQVTSKGNVSNPKPGDPRHPLAAGAHAPAVAFDTYNQSVNEHTSQTIKSPQGAAQESVGAVLQATQVRRLTPRECERLQGFPDDYTQIPYRKKTADQCPDGPRYKALGNSMAVPVMRWIGERIDLVEGIEQNRSAA